MFPFTAPIDDILFSITHVAEATTMGGWDDELCQQIISHFAPFAEDVIAPLNSIGDQEGAQLVNGQVVMPAGFKDAYRQLADNGWQGLTAPEDFGGMGLSPLMAAGVSEIFSGANHAMQMVCCLVPGAVTTLLHHGSTEQQAEWIPKLAAGEVLNSMCLSEPGAGSDLSAIRCKATPSDDGTWRIDGEKIFISGGGQDMSEHIMHLVLARSGAVDDGIQGLSLYLCPQSAGVTVTRLEDKMGIHASPTCQMRFDNAQAELVGQEGGGLKAMFTLMNHARLDVALQGVAHAARSHDIAQTYTHDRTQGRTADGVAATLNQHPDVARMLDEQASLAIGARAMCHITYAVLEHPAAGQEKLADFLTPLCKIFCSEAGVKSADIGMQLLGGYGYLREYGMEQIWRDARITAIYEGANGIHEKSMATRMLRPDQGSAAFADLITQLASGHDHVLSLLDDWIAASDRMRACDDPLPLAHAFATQTTTLFFSAAWAKINSVAVHHPRPSFIKRLAQHVLAPISP